MRGVGIRHDWLRHDHRGRGRRGAVESDALTIVSQWKEFRTPDFEAIKSALRTPVVFDGRNLYEPAVMAELGLEYHCIGRPQATPQPCG